MSFIDEGGHGVGHCHTRERNPLRGSLRDPVEDEFFRTAGVLKSILESPGGEAWLNEMGGADLLTDEQKRMLEGSDVRQRALVHGVSGTV